jgi:signal transduction histidine kinase
MAEDQQTTARQWIEQVAGSAEPSTAEWDFVNGDGQRIKLEISSRLIEQNGKHAEVEGIARDITERRRLERQLLEISSREQRRIGHDLHDGVCQQLAGIAYLLDILGDKLQDKAAPEAAEAEKIGVLINEATLQARGVARGLFPVRLEENGLVSALEELAESSAKRFRIECAFNHDSLPSTVDNEVALHLYYIAQEAMLNAVKHGKASSIQIVLRPEGDRHMLLVQDNGRGFDLADASRAGMGIRIMRYRAKVIGATLDVQSHAGQGTTVTCLYHPVRREAALEKSNV